MQSRQDSLDERPQYAPPLKAGVDIGRCLNDAVDVFTKNILVLVIAGFLFFVLSVFSLLVLTGPLMGGISLMTLEAMRREDKRVDLAKLFAGFNRFGSLLLLFVIVLICVLLGTLFFIIPGLVLMTLWLFPFYLMVDKQVDVITSLKMSYQVVMRRGFWPNLLLALLVFAIVLGPELVPYVGVVIGFVASPFAWLLTTSAYLQEVYEDKPDTDEPMSQAAQCGRCSYVMRGLSNFTCPECGADLREVGMIPTQL